MNIEDTQNNKTPKNFEFEIEKLQSFFFGLIQVEEENLRTIEENGLSISIPGSPAHAYHKGRKEAFEIISNQLRLAQLDCRYEK